MLLRGVIEHVKNQAWLAIAIDFVIVVVGVFIGIQVSNWNQGRVDRDKAASYRERLVNELQFNGRQYRQQVAYYTIVKRHGLAALASLQGRGGSDGEKFAVDAYQATQMDLSPAKHFVFDELVSAGLVGLLGGDALQQLASDYYLSLETNVPQMSEAPPYRDILRRAMPYRVQARVRDRCGDRLVYWGKQPIGVTLPEDCALGLTESEVSEGCAGCAQCPKSLPTLPVISHRSTRNSRCSTELRGKQISWLRRFRRSNGQRPLPTHGGH